MNRKSLVVIPFTNVSQNADDEYFSDGITDELLVILHKIKGFKTISRTSSFYLKNKQLSLLEIAEMFGVEYVLEGSVRKSKTSARITVQLIEIANETVLISEVYENDLIDILKVQATIASNIAQELKGVFDDSSMPLSLSQNPVADEHYLKGNYHWYRYTKEEIEKAVKHFQESINIEPEFALANAGLAKSCVVLGALGYGKPDIVFPRAKHAAQQAILVNNRIVEPHLSSAMVSMFYDGSLTSARKHLDQALKLNPNNAATYACFAKYYMLRGQLEKAEDEALLAIEIDPLVLTYHADLFRTYYYMGRYDDALKVCDNSLEIDETFLPALNQKGWIYTILGELDKALNIFTRLKTKSNNGIESLAGLCYAFARSGFIAESQTSLREIIAQKDQHEIGAISFQLAIGHIGLRNHDEAFANIRKSIEHKLGVAGYELLCNPVFHQLKSDQRFIELFKNAILIDQLYPQELTGYHAPNVITIHTNTKEKILLNANDLLFAQANNNYTQIYWKEGNGVKSSLLRMNLADLEMQLSQYQFIMRSHKSFLLNVKEKWTIKGNARGYSFKSILSPTPVPVSRSKVQEVLSRFNEYHDT
jgi:TolB-like protein/Tfp pilus assembly protein PilF